MLLIDNKVEVVGINEAIKAMKNIDKEAVKALRKDLKTALTPTAKQIASKVPTNAPLSGFNHNGRTRWTGAVGRVAFTPAKIRKGQDMHPIVSVVLKGKGDGAGFDIAEIAGSRNFKFTRPRSKEFTRAGASGAIRTRQNGQGKAMVREMASRGRAPWSYAAGRFGFGYFLLERKSMQKIATDILSKQQAEFNKQIRRAA